MEIDIETSVWMEVQAALWRENWTEGADVHEFIGTVGGHDKWYAYTQYFANKYNRLTPGIEFVLNRHHESLDDPEIMTHCYSEEVMRLWQSKKGPSVLRRITNKSKEVARTTVNVTKAVPAVVGAKVEYRRNLHIGKKALKASIAADGAVLRQAMKEVKNDSHDHACSA